MGRGGEGMRGCGNEEITNVQMTDDKLQMTNYQ